MLTIVLKLLSKLFRMFTPKRLNRKSSRFGIGSPATPLRGGTPGTPGRNENSTSVPIKVFEILKFEPQASIINGGFALGKALRIE